MAQGAQKRSLRLKKWRWVGGRISGLVENLDNITPITISIAQIGGKVKLVGMNLVLIYNKVNKKRLADAYCVKLNCYQGGNGCLINIVT